MAFSQTASSWASAAPALQGEGPWQYNRWLGRWRQRGPRPGSGAGGNADQGAGECGMPFDDSDRALVERVKAGDVRAFEMLHRRYYARIYRFAFMRLGNADDASDVASTTFCRALDKLHSYQFRRTPSIYPWLHQIASNLVIDAVRDRPAGDPEVARRNKSRFASRSAGSKPPPRSGRPSGGAPSPSRATAAARAGSGAGAMSSGRIGAPHRCAAMQDRPSRRCISQSAVQAPKS